MIQVWQRLVMYEHFWDHELLLYVLKSVDFKVWKTYLAFVTSTSYKRIMFLRGSLFNDPICRYESFVLSTCHSQSLSAKQTFSETEVAKGPKICQRVQWPQGSWNWTWLERDWRLKIDREWQYVSRGEKFLDCFSLFRLKRWGEVQLLLVTGDKIN